MLVLLAGVPRLAAADASKCKARIALESARFVQTKMKALSGCHEFVLKGTRPGPCPDARALATIDKAAAKMKTRIARSCGGANHVCGDADDEPLAAIGWDVETCGDFGGAGCTNAIADCGGIGDCLACVGGAAADRVAALVYDALEPSTPLTTLNSCQIRLGKESLRLVRSTSKALQHCWDAVNDGRAGGPCALPGDGRAQPAILHAEEKAVSRICAVCGGHDGACDGTDDLEPGTIGFVASCPALDPPSGGSCGAPVGSLHDLVDCVDCVARHAVDCVDALAVPWGAAYPAACNP